MIQINIASLNSELKQGLILLCEDYDFALSDTVAYSFLRNTPEKTSCRFR